MRWKTVCLSTILLAALTAERLPAQTGGPGIAPLPPGEFSNGVNPDEFPLRHLPPLPDEPQLPHLPPLPDEEHAGMLPFDLAPSETWLEVVPFNPIAWDGSVELGINGSSGNSETFSMQTGGDLKRETERSIWAFDFKYAKTNTGGVETQNYGLANLKYEHLFSESPWSLYVRTGGQYDEFRSYDFLFFINTGLGYALIDTESTKLKGRNGLGTSRRFGAENDDWTPEFNLGLDFEHQLTERQKFTSVIDYFPSWENFADYRMVADFGWELLLDAEANLSLKLSVVDIYDSTPEESKPNDLNYALLLLWKL